MTKICFLKFVSVLVFSGTFAALVEPNTSQNSLRVHLTRWLGVDFGDILSDIAIDKIDFATFNPAQIQFDRSNITVFGVDVSDFENALARSMLQTYKFYNNKSTEDILMLATNELNNTAVEAASLLKRMLDSVQRNSTEKSFVKCVHSQTDEIIMTEKFETMKSKVEHIIEVLESIGEGDSDHVKSKLNVIKVKLHEVIDEFISNTSIFRQYYEVTAGSLLTITTVYSRLYVMFLAHNQLSGDTKVLPCRLAPTLEDYRDFYSSWRLSQIRPQTTHFDNHNYRRLQETPQMREISYVLHEPFNRAGYTDFKRLYWAHNGCSNGSTICIADDLDGNIYEANGYGDFLCRIRHKVEMFFQRSIDASIGICEKFSDGNFNRPKCVTDYGWLQIRSRFFLRTTDKKDSYKNRSVTIYVNGTAVYRTPPIDPNCTYKLFDIIYTTARIEKTAPIYFALYENEDRLIEMESQSAPIYLLVSWTRADAIIYGSALWKDEVRNDFGWSTEETSSSSLSMDW